MKMQLAALLPLLGTAVAHSWPERTTRLAPNGTMVGPSGVERNQQHKPLVEDSVVWLLPPNGPAKVLHPDHKIVRPDQRALTSQSYSENFLMLSVAPGDFVAISYKENGHVTQGDIGPLKPINRGTIYLYGTTENDLTNTNLVDVHLAWTADGTGGDGKGRLLASRHFDDGECHEPIPANGDQEGIITHRMNRHKANGDEVLTSLVCQSDLQIPFDAPIGSPYTVIWVWDWPTMSQAGVAVPPASYYSNVSTSGEPHVTELQYYTGVVDFNVVDPCDASLGELKGPGCGVKGGQVKNVVKFVKQGRPSKAGIRAQMMKAFMVDVPQAGNNAASATADPADIPMAALIGIERPPHPLDAKFLAPANPSSPENPSAPETPDAPETTASPAPTAAPNVPGVPELGNVLIVTVTVPASTVTVTETRTASEARALPTGALGTGSPAQPQTTPRVRGRSGQRYFPRNL
ncbi:hypothetical protein B0T18DRAFT_435839 [Schizothecium vesticola]|uniref:DUF7492 domain-containing protein n=1 Tax=Schizothecium vesticola TaxID=314040 RepID=A0AA40KA32_9PEZI|nr:hypothetical protein B0T18DRAFT_435839 [Schizothecium vesticola]